MLVLDVPVKGPEKMEHTSRNLNKKLQLKTNVNLHYCITIRWGGGGKEFGIGEKSKTAKKTKTNYTNYVKQFQLYVAEICRITADLFFSGLQTIMRIQITDTKKKKLTLACGM